MDDDDAYTSGVKADITLDESVKNYTSNTQVNDFVCIEEISDEDSHSVGVADSLQNADENVNIVDKFEVVQNIPKDNWRNVPIAAKKDVSINIPIHIVGHHESQNVEDILVNEALESERLPTISTPTTMIQGRVRIL